MNDIIVSQQIRKRRSPVRPVSPFALPVRKTRPSMHENRADSAFAARFGRIKAAASSRFSNRTIISVPLAVFAVVLLAVVSNGAFTRARAAALESTEDPVYQRDMRSYAGLHPIDSMAPSGDTPPLDLAETFRFESYTVKPGESLSSIAAKHGLSIGSVVAANGISNAKKVYSGTVLKIPNMDGLPYTVRKGDNLSRIAASYGIPLEAILDANDLNSADINPGMKLFLPGARMSGSELRQILGDAFVYPIRGLLTSTFGWRNDPFTGVRRFHAAIDLAAPLGTPVRASMDGRVSVVGYNSVYGKYIILTHAGGYQTWYAHLNEYRTEKGDSVKQGQRIGDVGSTGYSTGSHVHFAVFKNGRVMNPLAFLPRR